MAEAELANRRLQPLGHVSGDKTSVSATSGTVKDRSLRYPNSGPAQAGLGRLALVIRPAS